MGQKTRPIPDTAAYRLVFLSLTLTPSADSKALARQSALIAQLGLSGADRTTLINTMAMFSGEHSQTSSASANPAQFNAAAEALVQRYQAQLLSILSGDGATKLAKFVQNAKSRMVVHQ